MWTCQMQQILTFFFSWRFLEYKHNSTIDSRAFTSSLCKIHTKVRTFLKQFAFFTSSLSNLNTKWRRKFTFWRFANSKDNVECGTALLQLQQDLSSCLEPPKFQTSRYKGRQANADSFSQIGSFYKASGTNDCGMERSFRWASEPARVEGGGGRADGDRLFRLFISPISHVLSVDPRVLRHLALRRAFDWWSIRDRELWGRRSFGRVLFWPRKLTSMYSIYFYLFFSYRTFVDLGGERLFSVSQGTFGSATRTPTNIFRFLRASCLRAWRWSNAPAHQ